MCAFGPLETTGERPFLGVSFYGPREEEEREGEKNKEKKRKKNNYKRRERPTRRSHLERKKLFTCLSKWLSLSLSLVAPNGPLLNSAKRPKHYLEFSDILSKPMECGPKWNVQLNEQKKRQLGRQVQEWATFLQLAARLLLHFISHTHEHTKERAKRGPKFWRRNRTENSHQKTI